MRVLLTALLGLLAFPAAAQTQLTTPRASPHAQVNQTVGLTQLLVDYHRPSANGRAIWGALVPYGEVWRAGANENTVFQTSTDISVQGQPLPAGRYGLHLLPTDGDWTLIFSTVSYAWGSYSYDPAEDALRVTVTPREAPMQEALAYRFDTPTSTSTALVLHWGELEVPVQIEADTPNVVLENMERELRGVAGFYWNGWDQIAAYALDHSLRLDDALAWSQRSIELTPTFSNRMTHAQLLESLERPGEAESVRGEAYASASEEEVRAYARARRRAGRPDQADAILARLDDLP